MGVFGLVLAGGLLGACGFTCGLTWGAGAGGAEGCGLFMAATVVGATCTVGLTVGATIFGVSGAGAGGGAEATFCSPAAAAGTRKGLFVNGQTTLDPALIPRTSTNRGGEV